MNPAEVTRSPIGASSSTSWAQAEEVATQIAANVAAAIKRGMEEFPGGISEDELDLTRAEQPLAGVARNEIGHDGRAEWTANCGA
jgi:hypothetical protein